MNFIRKAAQFLPTLGLLFGFGVLVAVVSPDMAVATCSSSDLSIQSGADCARGSSQPAQLFGDGSVFKRITDILLFLVGAIAVIMLIIGGIRYVVSGGDQTQVTAAKNTILYAIIGIVVALLAYAAIDFVLKTLLKGL
ncbi:MAG TPA: pilin [Candidatus Saccharibacteria bacterium]|nr:pilin [Candidatus Saccharibacteria bacterium]